MVWRKALARDTAIASGLGLCADLVCQCGFENKPLTSIDQRRAAAVTAFSGLYIGVVCTSVYSLYPPLSTLLMRSAPFRIPGSSARIQGVVSTLADNILHVPFLYLPAYFLTIGPMQGDSFSDTWVALRQQWWPTLSTCWLFWCPFMAVNFSVIPGTHRVRAVAVANFCWTITLDYITHKKGNH